MRWSCFLSIGDHAARCRLCGPLTAGMRAVVAASSSDADPEMRERALEAAMFRLGRGERQREGRSASYRWVLAGLAVAGAAALVLTVRARLGPTGDVVAAGELRGAESHVAGSVVPEGRALEAAPGTRLVLARAQIDVHAPARMRWERGRRLVTLEQGAIVVSASAEAPPLTVTTARFQVEVLAGRCTVSTDAVRVVEGRARVRGPDGRVLVSSLSAGDDFALPAPPQPQVVREPARVEPPPPLPSAPPPARPKPPAPVVDETPALREVRQLLARGDTAAAEERLDALTIRSFTRAGRAEAETLRAELALVRGDRVRAARTYGAIAETYADLRAGEVALFSGARLATEAGDKAQARSLLERYLQRHPRGIFARDAKRRLDALARP